jgi:hypothetical protein
VNFSSIENRQYKIQNRFTESLYQPLPAEIRTCESAFVLQSRRDRRNRRPDRNRQVRRLNCQPKSLPNQDLLVNAKAFRLFHHCYVPQARAFAALGLGFRVSGKRKTPNCRPLPTHMASA